MNSTLVMIFTRNPELGKVKTRLAKTIGDENALIIYKYLLNHVEKTVRQIDCDKATFYSVKISNKDVWNNNVYEKKLQKGEGLGDKMFNAFKHGFSNNYKKVVIIGSDLYNITPNHIKTAVKKLDTHDVVIGPSPDGGYYLLGLKELNIDVFENKEWSTNTVLNDTIKSLNSKSIHLLDPINDIDTFEDIKDIPELMQLIDFENPNS